MMTIETDRKTLRMLARRAGGGDAGLLANNEVLTADALRVSELARRIVRAADLGPIALEVEN